MTGIPLFEGFGLGLRPQHFSEFLETDVPVDFVEVISENFLVGGGRPLHVLDKVRAQYPVAMHGVSLSIGSADGVDPDYLARLKALADRIDPLWVSDHLCWTGIEGFNSHDLLPLPYTEEALSLVSAYVGKRLVGGREEPTDQPLLNRRGAQMVGKTATLAEPIATGWIASVCRIWCRTQGGRVALTAMRNGRGTPRIASGAATVSLR